MIWWRHLPGRLWLRTREKGDDLHLTSTLALFCSILDRQNEKKHTSPWRTILQLENINFGSYQTVREVLIFREVKNFLGGIFFVFQIKFHRMLLFCFAFSVYMRHSISQVTSFLRTQKQSVQQLSVAFVNFNVKFYVWDEDIPEAS